MEVSSTDPNPSRDLTDQIGDLPLEANWPPISFRRLNNFYVPEVYVQGIIAMQQSFQARPDDVFVLTHPKSGTTWLKALAFATMTRTQHRFDDHPLLRLNPHECIPFLEKFFSVPSMASRFEAMPSPRMLSAHLAYSLLPASVQASGCRLVYICREPKDVLVSLWHFSNKLMFGGKPVEEPLPLEKAFDMFCKGVCMNGPIWEHVLEYWQESLRRPEKVLFLKYEEMLDEPAAAVKRLAEFMGCPFSREEEVDGVVQEIIKLCSFQELRALEVNKNGIQELFSTTNDVYFRKGEKGDWRNYLSPEMARKLEEITEEKLKGSGLSFGST